MNNIILNQDDIDKGQIAPFKERAQNIIDQAERAVVTDQTQFAAAGDLVKIGRNELARMEDARKAAIKQPQDYVRWVNARFKELVEPLKSAVESVALKATGWAREEERRRFAEEQRLRKAAEDEALRKAQEQEELARQAKEKAAKARSDAEAADDPSDQAAALEAAAAAEQEAQSHASEADNALSAAADVPDADVAVRGVRGNFGTTTGVRKTLTFAVHDLDGMPREFKNAILENQKAVEAIRVAIKKDKTAMEYFDKYLRDKATKHLNEMDQVTIAGITIFYDQSLGVR